MKKPLKILARRFFPAFVAEEHPQMITFMEKVFEHMDQQQHAYDVVSNLLDYNDVDTTLPIFEEAFKTQYLANFPDVLATDLDLLVKNIRSFYLSKGTEESFKFLFKALFNSDVEFKYPKFNILRASDGIYYTPQFLVLTDGDENIPPENSGTSYNVINLVDKFITGTQSGAVAFIDSTTTLVYPPVGPVKAVSILEAEGEFIPGEQILIGDTIVDNGSFLRGLSSWTLVPAGAEGFSADGSLVITQPENDIQPRAVTQAVMIEDSQQYWLRFTQKSADSNLNRVTVGYTPGGNQLYDSGPLGIAAGSQTVLLPIPLAGREVLYVSVHNNMLLANESCEFDGISLVKQDVSNAPLMYVANLTGVSGVIDGNPTWLDKRGMISEGDFANDQEQVLQDGAFYQDFSYQLKSNVSINQYEKLVKDLVHPSGFALFSSVIPLADLTTYSLRQSNYDDLTFAAPNILSRTTSGIPFNVLFRKGDQVTIQGSGVNDGWYIVEEVAPQTLTFRVDSDFSPANLTGTLVKVGTGMGILDIDEIGSSIDLAIENADPLVFELNMNDYGAIQVVPQIEFERQEGFGFTWKDAEAGREPELVEVQEWDDLIVSDFETRATERFTFIDPWEIDISGPPPVVAQTMIFASNSDNVSLMQVNLETGDSTIDNHPGLGAASEVNGGQIGSDGDYFIAAAQYGKEARILAYNDTDGFTSIGSNIAVPDWTNQEVYALRSYPEMTLRGINGGLADNNGFDPVVSTFGYDPVANTVTNIQEIDNGTYGRLEQLFDFYEDGQTSGYGKLFVGAPVNLSDGLLTFTEDAGTITILTPNQLQTPYIMAHDRVNRRFFTWDFSTAPEVQTIDPVTGIITTVGNITGLVGDYNDEEICGVCNGHVVTRDFASNIIRIYSISGTTLTLEDSFDTNTEFGVTAMGGEAAECPYTGAILIPFINYGGWTPVTETSMVYRIDSGGTREFLYNIPNSGPNNYSISRTTFGVFLPQIPNTVLQEVPFQVDIEQWWENGSTGSSPFAYGRLHGLDKSARLSYLASSNFLDASSPASDDADVSYDILPGIPFTSPTGGLVVQSWHFEDGNYPTNDFSHAPVWTSSSQVTEPTEAMYAGALGSNYFSPYKFWHAMSFVITDTSTEQVMASYGNRSAPGQGAGWEIRIESVANGENFDAYVVFSLRDGFGTQDTITWPTPINANELTQVLINSEDDGNNGPTFGLSVNGQPFITESASAGIVDPTGSGAWTYGIRCESIFSNTFSGEHVGAWFGPIFYGRDKTLSDSNASWLWNSGNLRRFDRDIVNNNNLRLINYKPGYTGVDDSELWHPYASMDPDTDTLWAQFSTADPAWTQTKNTALTSDCFTTANPDNFDPVHRLFAQAGPWGFATSEDNFPGLGYDGSNATGVTTTNDPVYLAPGNYNYVQYALDFFGKNPLVTKPDSVNEKVEFIPAAAVNDDFCIFWVIGKDFSGSNVAWSLFPESDVANQVIRGIGQGHSGIDGGGVELYDGITTYKIGDDGNNFNLANANGPNKIYCLRYVSGTYEIYALDPDSSNSGLNPQAVLLDSQNLPSFGLQTDMRLVIGGTENLTRTWEGVFNEFIVTSGLDVNKITDMLLGLHNLYWYQPS